MVPEGEYNSGHMSNHSLAVPGPNGPHDDSFARQLQAATIAWPPEKLAMAALFARGLKKAAIVRKFAALGADQKRVRGQIRKWKKEEAFQDLIWTLCMEDMRLCEPTVVMAMLKKAQRGDVMGAKFFLELTGRYSPKPEAIQASQINLILPETVGRPVRDPEIVQSDLAHELRAKVLSEE